MGDENSLAGATKAHRHSAVSSDGGFLETTVTGMTNLGNGSLITGDASNIQTEISAGSAGDLLEMGATLPQWTAPVSVSSTWTKLAETTLLAPATTIDATWALADVKDFLRVFVYTLDGGGTIRRYLSFYDSAGVADVGNNYASQWNTSFGGVTTATNATGIAGTDNGSAFETIDVGCYDSTECKLVVRHGCANTSNSAGVSPTSRQIFGKWADVTNFVRGIKIWDGGSGGLFQTGSSLLVLGTDR